jgi:hypothetical protein
MDNNLSTTLTQKFNKQKKENIDKLETFESLKNSVKHFKFKFIRIFQQLENNFLFKLSRNNA